MNKTMEKINYLNQYGGNNLTEKPLEYYLEVFEKTGPHKISSRLGIPYDSLRKEFTFAFLGQTYTARYPDLQIIPVDSEDNLFARNPKARILLLRYLLYSTVYFPDGEFKSYREFPSGELYYNVFRGRCIQRLLRSYSGRIPDFKEATGKLGGILIPGGDAAVELELFDNLYIRFLLWEGDEEFPASSQILFSSNFPAAFSAYDLTEIVEIILGVMKEKGVQK